MLMASLSAQLAIYSLAWLVLGLGYRLRQKVALMWGFGWMAGALCTLLLYLPIRLASPFQDLAVNGLIVCSFLLLQSGVDGFTGRAFRVHMPLAAFAGVLVVTWLQVRHGDVVVLRVWLFTAVVFVPLFLTQWRVIGWLRAKRDYPRWLILLMAAPVQITMGLFVARAVLVSVGTEVGAVDFRAGSEFDLLATLLFLVVLGAFNFSLASLVLGSLIDQLRNLSQTDQLTGLFNRRVMMRRLSDEHERHLRGGPAYSVVMMDLDHFKQINDTHGHGVGDQVLREMARVLGTCVRRTDTLARTGGEEFMLLLPMTDEASALVLAQRVCAAVAATNPVTDAGALSVTVSAGVADARSKDASYDAVVSLADAALYRAKAAGRNRACPARSTGNEQSV